MDLLLAWGLCTLRWSKEERELAETLPTDTNAFRMTGLYPFNPLAANQSKLKPGESYQTSDDTAPGDNVYEDFVNVATADIPEDVIVMDAVPLSPEPGPSSALDHSKRNNSLPVVRALLRITS